MTTYSQSAVRPSPVFLGVVAIAIAGGVLAWISDFDSIAAKAGVFTLVVAGWIVTLSLHEFAHAYLAWRAGDHEVEMRGYLTLNPLKYAHPLLSIILPLAFIALGGIGLPGGAVYVHSHRFPPNTQRAISLAGPAMNALAAVVLLAVVVVFGYDGRPSFVAPDHAAFWFGLTFLAFLQVTAAVLNLLPIPGLDGFGLIEPSLSPRTRSQLMQYAPLGFLAVFALLTIGPINAAFWDLVLALFDLSGVPRDWVGYGDSLFRFWL